MQASNDPRTRGPAAGTTAVWSLLLPSSKRVLCHAHRPPQFLREILWRDARVDIVTRCDLETWTREAPPTARLHCLWEPDADAEYDLAVLWDPRSLHDVRTWLAALAALPVPPREIAVWSRNPARGSGPLWPAVDLLLWRAGWRLGASHLGLPGAERVRQIVAWQDYGQTPLIRHRRTHRAWKGWMARLPASRWLLPARLRRASLRNVTPEASVLDRVLAASARHTRGVMQVDRFLVSPNGVAIAALSAREGRGIPRAILKIPYTLAAEGRVAGNAAGLEWMAAHASDLGPWSHVAPKFLGAGRVGAWSYTVEEQVEGHDAQGWSTAAGDEATQVLAVFLERLAQLGGPSRPLAPAELDRVCGAPVRRTAALVDSDLAVRLVALGERVARELAGVPIPRVPRHGDFKLENVLGEPFQPEHWRVVDWELWSPAGLPLLDLWHLLASRRARIAGCSMGAAVQRWLLQDALSDVERALVHRVGRGLDPRYVALSPVLYWLDRLGPVAARGRWPTPGWERANVVPVVEALVTK